MQSQNIKCHVEACPVSHISPRESYNTQLDFPDFFKPHLDVIIHNYISLPLLVFFYFVSK